MGRRLADIRRDILQQHGVESVQVSKSKKQVRRRPEPVSRVSPKLKTKHMLYLEYKYGESIELILTAGSLYAVGKRLGIDRSTISRWRKRLGLIYSPTNLPPCKGCQLVDVICQSTGTCHILTRSHASEELIVIKSKEVLS